MSKRAAKAPRPTSAPVGTPGLVAKVVSGARERRAVKAPTTPAPAPPKITAPKIPGDTIAKRPRGRPAGTGTSDHPDAVRARRRRQEARERKARELTPSQLPPQLGAQLTPDAVRAASSTPAALSGPISPAPSPEARAAAVRSWAGLIKCAGIIGSLFGGEHWKVSEDDAIGAAELCQDAWPEMQLADTKQLLAFTALGGMTLERVNRTKAERRAAGNRTELREVPPTKAPAPARTPDDSPARPIGWAATRAG